MTYSFNYIITIHNKEHLITEVLNGIKKCAGNNSKIYPVLDGCTDNSESIIDQFKIENPDLNIIKVYENDVHELLAINAALRVICHDNECQLNIILQDDVVLNDPLLEKHFEILFSRFQGRLGVVSMRHGGDLSSFLLDKKSIIFPIKNYVETVFGHGVSGKLRDLAEGSFVFKDIAIKSPICIPSYMIKKIGIPDEEYRPWDDIAYCYKSLQDGFKNGVLSIPFISDKDWGTMRKKSQQKKHDEIVLRNLEIFRNVNRESLRFFFKSKVYDNKIYQIWIPNFTNKTKPRYFNFFKSKLRQLFLILKMLIKNDKN